MTLKEFNTMCHQADHDGVDSSTFELIQRVYMADERITKQDILELHLSARNHLFEIDKRIKHVRNAASTLADCPAVEFTERIDRLISLQHSLVDYVTDILNIIRCGK